ncbi:MAG: ABC transporter ATP-binding protein [Thiotrichales bacterium]|nr:ABC transporter ATP-binding protein [Thiotrichales bacterium]
MNTLSVHIHDKSFPTYHQPVLEDLVLNVGEGEFVSILGPSGSGKTTLLNIIGGLDQAYSGQLNINGSLTRHLQDSIRCSYVFQEPRLMPWLTVEKNIELVMGDYPIDKRNIKHLLEDVELDEFSKSYPLQLSGGMQRRVGLARAFAVKPELLLMDEPFISLDVPTANRLRDHLIALWHKSKPTIIFVTHDLNEAILLSDRLIFLSQKPATVIKELTVNIKRPRMVNDSSVNKLHEEILQENPDLLGGNISESQAQENMQYGGLYGSEN